MPALLVISMFLTPIVSANSAPIDQTCHPTRPTDPSSEDSNPGAGGFLGLNDDSDLLRGTFGKIVSQDARSQQGPHDPPLRDLVGNDCAKGAGE
jgi:hypothetical protein